MKTNNGFLTGFAAGIIIMILLYLFIISIRDNKPFKYAQLKDNFKIEDIGTLKKGTILRIDKSMSEGFTRYILYLNLKGDKTEHYKTEQHNLIIPYWLEPSDTVN